MWCWGVDGYYGVLLSGVGLWLVIVYVLCELLCVCYVDVVLFLLVFVICLYFGGCVLGLLCFCLLVVCSLVLVIVFGGMMWWGVWCFVYVKWVVIDGFCDERICWIFKDF